MPVVSRVPAVPVVHVPYVAVPAADVPPDSVETPSVAVALVPVPVVPDLKIAVHHDVDVAVLRARVQKKIINQP